MTMETVEDFERRVQAFFEEHAELAPDADGWGSGDDVLVSAGLTKEAHRPEDLERAKKFQQQLFDNGLAWLTGPTEHGGAGLATAHVKIFREVAQRYETPDTSGFMIGQRIVAPAILLFGRPDQKEQWLPAIWRGDSVACQVFSEPEAGSDLASLRCRARPDGDGWRISGQKVWSSGAHMSDVGEVLTRTEDDLDLRHKGLTMFLVDMSAPGVQIRPLQQMNGNAHFTEVFFDDVWVPSSAMLGERTQGWSVANASLVSERDLPPEDSGLFLHPIDRLIELARVTGASSDPIVRQRLVDQHARSLLGRLTADRLRAMSGPVSDVMASLSKLYESHTMWQVAQCAAEILGARVTADSGEWGTYCWADVVLSVQSQRIAGGTDEIQRNIIAERGLGLPREPISKTTTGAST